MLISDYSVLIDKKQTSPNIVGAQSNLYGGVDRGNAAFHRTYAVHVVERNLPLQAQTYTPVLQNFLALTPVSETLQTPEAYQKIYGDKS